MSAFTESYRLTLAVATVPLAAIVMVLPLILLVIAPNPLTVNVPPPATLPEPVVPAKLIVVLTALVVMLLIRPLASTIIVGILVALP